jgi:hypothetical protein
LSASKVNIRGAAVVGVQKKGAVSPTLADGDTIIIAKGIGSKADSPLRLRVIF